MESENNLAQLIGRVLAFVLVAFVMTVAVYLGSRVLGRKLTRAQFLSMFAISCVIWLVLIFIASSA